MTHAQARAELQQEIACLTQRWLYTRDGSAAEESAHNALYAAQRDWMYHDSIIRNGEGE